MTMDAEGPHLVRDDVLTRELRTLHAPPADATYWTALEHRIIARLEAAARLDDVWWLIPTPWLRIGLAAAGFALLVAGTLLLQTQTQVARAPYEAVTDPSGPEGPMLAEQEHLTEQQATIRLLTGQ